VNRSAKPDSQRQRIRLVIGFVIFLTAAVLFSIYNAEVIGFSNEVWQNIKRVPVALLVVAVTFRLLEALFTALSWSNVLKATYPEKRIPFKVVLGGYQGGIGINVISPVEAGTVATIGLFRLAIAGSRVPTLLAAFAVHQLAFAFFGILMYLFLVFAHPGILKSGVELLQPVWEYLTAGSTQSLIAIGVATVITVALVFLLWGRYRKLRDQIQPAAQILRDPRRYMVSVFLPASIAYICRWVVTGTFMAAFGIPVTVYTLLLALAAYSVAGIVRVTPGGLGPKQALTVLVLRDYAEADVALAYSLTQEFVTATFSIIFALITMAWAFGWATTRNFFRERSSELAGEKSENAPGR
jgi:uncharacterized membrane protein YbhN (UPF0104 family)